MRSDDLTGVIESVTNDATPFVKVAERIVSSAHVRDVARLRRIAQLESVPVESSGAAEIERLTRELEQLRASRSWRYTAPLRSFSSLARRIPGAVQLVRWVRLRVSR